MSHLIMVKRFSHGVRLQCAREGEKNRCHVDNDLYIVYETISHIHIYMHM